MTDNDFLQILKWVGFLNVLVIEDKEDDNVSGSNNYPHSFGNVHRWAQGKPHSKRIRAKSVNIQ